MKIGWIGLGNMGIPMAENLLVAGHTLFVYNRTREKVEPLLKLGAVLVENPKDFWIHAELVFTMLSDDEAVKSVYLNHLIQPGTQGKLAIDMSTISPSTSKEIAASCRDAGIQFLDAPVSGSVIPAKEGNLVIMVGGEEETYQKAKPLFDVLGKTSIHLGKSGSGSSAKLAINLLLGIVTQGIAESTQFAKQQGIDQKHMLEIINQSAVGSAYSRMKTPSLLQGEFPAAFAFKHMAKDLRLVHESGANTPLAEAVYQTFQQNLSALGEEDVMAIIKSLH